MFRLLAEVLWEFLIGRTIERVWSAVMAKGNVKGNPFDDPVYKRNVEKLIERNRKLENARNNP